MKVIDNIVEKLGQLSSWLNIILIVLIGLDVALRYVFSSTENWVLELEWHIYSIIFLMGASYALQKDEHVRVDLFYQNISPNSKAWINILGHILFLIPWTFVIIKTSYIFAANSFSFNESSPNPGGLPFRFVIKFFIVIGFVLLFLQGVSQIVTQLKLILKRDKTWN